MSDPLKVFFEGFDRWLKYTCYLAFVWVFLDILPLLPVDIAERLIDAILKRLGI